MKINRSKLEKMRSLKHDWNSYGAEPPNEWAISKTNEILDECEKIDLEPSHFGPSVINGVGISFSNGNKKLYAYIEPENNGELYALIRDSDKNSPDIWEVDNIKESLLKIKNFLESKCKIH